MRWREYEADGAHVGGVRSGGWRSGRMEGIRLAILVGSVCTCAMVWAGSGMAATERCPNEEFRTGPSASLPDCRAYELVTPEELGRSQAIAFTTTDKAIPSADGEHLALETFAALEPDPDIAGTRGVFSRTAQGWKARSAVASGADEQQIEMELLSPNLSLVAIESFTELNEEQRLNSPRRYEVGPVGGPYALVAEVPGGPRSTFLAGANAGTASVPALTDVLVESEDNQLLPEGPERILAEERLPGPGVYSANLYEWTDGTLHLVNVEGEGSHVKMLNRCGARLGAGYGISDHGPNTPGAVSADGSKIFFTTGAPERSCEGLPPSLYMRVDGKETVEVSAPQGVKLKPSERAEVRYDAATPDGSEVVFNTSTPLLPGETTSENKLFIYNTVKRDLRLIVSSDGLPPVNGTGSNEVLLSENGSAVYYNIGESIYRYETQTGSTSFVATWSSTREEHERSYTTPNGQFLVFVSGRNPGVEVAGPHGLELEPRGAGHNELYRYDAADGSVMCVSCGEGVAPAEGEMIESLHVLATQNEIPPYVQMSENGQKVFFQTMAQLVPQDTNSTEENQASENEYPGMDVYEWEADGVEESPDVFCHEVNGCTHLISTGEDVGKATFLGASEDGSNIFFATAGQLVPQATPEFPNIYDARVDGGFAPPKKETECLSCQGVGSPPPLFNTPEGVTFMGAGNPVPLPTPAVLPKPKTKPKCKRGYMLNKHGKCVKAAKKPATRRKK